MRNSTLFGLHGLAALALVALFSSYAWGVDFKASGLWRFGVFGAELNMIQSYKTPDGQYIKNKQSDYIQGQQRLQPQLDFIASENVSGTIGWWIADPAQIWGKANMPMGGAALGADSPDVMKLVTAYMDWNIPDLDLKIRIGKQPIIFPFSAGGPSVNLQTLDSFTINWRASDNYGITAGWLRPFNDNNPGYVVDGERLDANYLDNMDLFLLSVPVSLEGFRINPWMVYGIRGRNTFKGLNGFNGGSAWSSTFGAPGITFYPYPGLSGMNDISRTTKPYGSIVWAGLPITVTALEGWKFELDINYGYLESMGNFTATKYVGPNYDIPQHKRASTKKEGWVFKAFMERAYDWGAPGLFGWYATGDQGDPSNGSGRMPTIVGYGNYTSFMGDGNRHTWRDRDINSTYIGTWGIGAQLRDVVSFFEDVDHTFRIAYWGGTNDPSMVKYMKTAYSWNAATFAFDGPYMTTNDGLIEFNIETNWQVYENFSVNLTLDYIANYMNNDTWNKAGMRNTSFSRQDIWKAVLCFQMEM